MGASLCNWDVLIEEVRAAYNMYGCKVVSVVWGLPVKTLNYHARLRGCASPAFGKPDQRKLTHLIADCRKYRAAGCPKDWKVTPFDPATYKMVSGYSQPGGVIPNRWGIPDTFEGDFMKEWRKKRAASSV